MDAEAAIAAGSTAASASGLTHGRGAATVVLTTVTGCPQNLPVAPVEPFPPGTLPLPVARTLPLAI